MTAARTGGTTRSRHGLLWVAVGAIALVALLFGADAAARGYAQHRFVAEIDKALPAGTSAPGLSVRLGGFSFFAQYLRGSFSSVDIDAPSIVTPGGEGSATGSGSVSASVHASDVRFDRAFAKPLVVGRLSGRVSADEAQINRIVRLPDQTASLSIGKGTVTYAAQTEVLGLPIGYSATVHPSLDGELVQLTPTSVDVGSGTVSFDVKQFLGGVLDGKPIPVCIAPYLPAGLRLSGLSLATHRASIGFDAKDFALSETSFDRHDSCPS